MDNILCIGYKSKKENIKEKVWAQQKKMEYLFYGKSLNNNNKKKKNIEWKNEKKIPHTHTENLL